MSSTQYHYILHKPFGYISQFKTDVKKKKMLGDLYSFAEGTMAIGRLDEDSEGLLLLTTDGKVSELVRRKHIEKEYYAQVDGLISAEAIHQLQQGVEIGIKGIKYQTRPCKAILLDPQPTFAERSRRIRDERHGPTYWISVTLTEGKLRQVRKMCAAVGYPVLRLIRIRIGKMHLNDLPVGAVLEVPLFDIE
ncbi:pseudouridine synthase [Bacteroidetes bacterium UKL13-3]|nr:pseudouridine synthase [Bacteroidetes bacterium UKL13-3]HCP93584.1 pseudouridine synthase [Bacteroidota bacterium]